MKSYYKWRPNASQRKEFRENMQNPEYAAAYHERKEARAAKRRASSKFDYNTAGGMYVPTRIQYDFCCSHLDEFKTPQEKDAANFVISAYALNEKVHHDFIHIVNEKIRAIR